MVILGGGESGVGSAILAKQKGYDVFLSDKGAFKQKYREPVKENLTEESHQIPELQDTEQVERMRQLYAGIQTLTGIDKAIILLFLDENSYHEIAAITGLTKTNVSVRLVRIKKELEQKLNKKI